MEPCLYLPVRLWRVRAAQPGEGRLPSLERDATSRRRGHRFPLHQSDCGLSKSFLDHQGPSVLVLRVGAQAYASSQATLVSGWRVSGLQSVTILAS
jgi:hypothetical protein